MAESGNQDQQVKRLRRTLEGWRMAILPLKSVLLWEQQWHPAAIFGALVFLHVFIWLLDLNFLTTFAVCGLIINFVDFIVPVVCNSLYGPDSWTGQKEKAFEEICQTIVVQYNGLMQYFSSFYALRERSPYLYYIISITALTLLAWIASSINNNLLFFLMSTTALLWPGLHHRGVFNTLLAMVNMAPKKKLM